jgi:tetratricopeptide (TPR) repeat protein
VAGLGAHDQIGAGPAQADYEQAIADLEPLGPSEELARVHSNFAVLLAMQLQSAASIAEAGKGIAVAAACGAAPARIEAVSTRALGLANIGRLKEAIAALDTCADEATAGGHFFIAGQALVNAADMLVVDCRPREALDRARRLRALPVGGWSALRGAIREGEALSLLGDPGPALSAFEEALALAQEGGTLVHQRWTERGMATVYHQLDRLDEALQLARGSRPRYQQERQADGILAIRLLLDTGQVQRARQEAVEVIADERDLATASLLDADTVAEALLAAGDLAAARRVATVVSADPDHPSWLSLQGRLALAEGDLEAARDHLQSAVARYASAGACRGADPSPLGTRGRPGPAGRPRRGRNGAARRAGQCAGAWCRVRRAAIARAAWPGTACACIRPRPRSRWRSRRWPRAAAWTAVRCWRWSGWPALVPSASASWSRPPLRV